MCRCRLDFSPLQIGDPVFAIGGAVFVLGLIGLLTALFNFGNAPPDQPATNGLYRLSRNARWVTLVLMFVRACLAVGSWVALIAFAVAAVCYHVRILAEERSCMVQHGDTHREHLARVSHYSLFF